MRAVAYTEPGSADVLELVELPEPDPAPGDVRVAVSYSAVNPTDVKRRQVEPPRFGSLQIPHHDGSGVIDRVGPGVSLDRVGERVWLFNAAHNRAHGTAADFVYLPSEQAVQLPDHCSLLDGATVGIPMMTAAHALRLAQIGEGETVLIPGAGGAVGSAAVTLAHARGVYVIACVSSDEKAQIAQDCGADDVIIYSRENLADGLITRGRSLNAVIDVAIGRNLSDYLPSLHDKACVVSYSSDVPEVNIPVRPLMFSNARLEFFVIYALSEKETEQAKNDVAEALENGVTARLPAQIFDINFCRQAHEHVEARSLGRAVLRISSEASIDEQGALHRQVDRR